MSTDSTVVAFQHPEDVDDPLTSVLREDTSVDGMPVDDVLANAPQASPPFFKVIKVLGDASGA